MPAGRGPTAAHAPRRVVRCDRCAAMQDRRQGGRPSYWRASIAAFYVGCRKRWSRGVARRRAADAADAAIHVASILLFLVRTMSRSDEFLEKRFSFHGGSRGGSVARRDGWANRARSRL